MHVIQYGLCPHLAYDGVNYECTICERFFFSESALYAHCRLTSRYQWCERCWRVFISNQAKYTHIKTSSRYNVCSICSQLQDFATGEELQDHLVNSHHFFRKCNVYHVSVEQLQEHDVNEHHLCVKCGCCFDKDNNLQMVLHQLESNNIRMCILVNTITAVPGKEGLVRV
jgi:hypothetical protein